MKRVGIILIALLSLSYISCNEKNNVDKMVRQVTTNEFHLSNFYNNKRAQLLFFNLDFKFENISRGFLKLRFNVRIPQNEIGFESIPIGFWISNVMVNNSSDWDWKMEGTSGEYLFISSDLDNSDNSNPTLNGSVSIVMAYKDNSLLQKEKTLTEGYCTLDRKDDTTQRYWYKCNKSPLATITINVCGVGENSAKTMAEDAMRELTTAPPDNKINIGCRD